MRIKQILLIIFVLLFQSVAGQQNEKSLDSILSLDINAKKKLEKIQKFSSYASINQSPQITHKLAIYFHNIKQYSKSVKYGKLTVELKANETPVDSLCLRKSICNLALFSLKNKNSSEAEKYYNILLEQKNNDKYRGKAYHNLGLIYKEVGDYYKALEYYQNAINSYEEIANHNKAIAVSLNMTDIYTFLGDKKSIEKAIIILEELQVSKKKLLTDHILLDVFLMLGNVYNLELFEHKEKSLTYYFKALHIAEKLNHEFYITTIYNNIGNIYLNYDIKKAYNYLTKGLKKSNIPHIQALFLHNLGTYYFKTKDYDNATKSVKQSIIKYLNYNGKIKLDEIPISVFESSVNKNYILEAFLFLIENQNYYKKSQEDLDIIYQYINIADKLLAYIRFESDDQQSKLYWIGQASRLYQNAVKTAFLSNSADNAFLYMEKNKAILLLEDISDKELKEKINLSDAIIEREKSLKNKIYTLLDLYTKSNPIKKDSVADMIRFSKRVYHNFIDSLKVDHLRYYNYKRPTEVKSLAEIQSLLKEDEIIVEYIFNQENGYGLLVEKNKVDLFELKDVPQLNTDIINFKSKITKPFVKPKEFVNYNKLAYKLFQNLFPFKNALAHLSTKKVIIIPDYNLQNLPFEALVFNPNTKNNKNHYLISVAEIRYAYSMSFLKENQAISRNHTIDFSGFAPVQFSYDKHPILKRSLEEIEVAKNLFSGSLFINNDATKENFIQNTVNSKIIHLSTHANATDSITPWIAFRNSKLTLNELYTTKNNAELVVLSICNSSQGLLKPGEGVMSLARGFFYAGANSVISSLWNVDDKSGQYITTHFYRHLKKEKTKSEALRLAKLSYLETHSLSEVSPYYWASLILVGDTSIIHSSSHIYLWIAIASCLFLMTFFWWKRKKS